ncbi:hypothetical protein RJ53_03715 [Methanocalculus chunghsingensis]|uniref:PEGA domain-containing protein n=1 Tax=Methanocalculus chunghsingensis TaxID=156457 RepID=A0A8J7W6L8_9EURY|nr:PEGA domain-containing protein [Methanocalculus chunghsingensis]MBR1368661.1 hypothetical protein [Methanocalculus chunghsingensis]
MHINTSILIAAVLVSLLLFISPAHAADTGSIEIISDPDNVEVYITNQFRGYTPITISDLRPGLTRISLKKPNYQNWDGVAYIIPGSTARLEPTLVPMGTLFRNTGNIVITTHPEAVVLQNQNYAGVADEKGSLIIAQTDLGLHLITIEKEGYYSYQEYAIVTSGQTTGVVIELTPLTTPVPAAPVPTPDMRVSPLPTPPEQSAPTPAIIIAGIIAASLTAGFMRRF